MYPATPYGRVVAASEIVCGLSFTAILTGLTFVRFSRPRAKLVFAPNPVVAMHNGKPTLMVQIGNGRASILMDAAAKLNVLLSATTAEGALFRRAQELRLERAHIPIFPLTWTLMHVLDERSPLRGYDAARAIEAQAQVFVTLEAHDPTLATAVHDIRNYGPEGYPLWHALCGCGDHSRGRNAGCRPEQNRRAGAGCRRPSGTGLDGARGRTGRIEEAVLRPHVVSGGDFGMMVPPAWEAGVDRCPSNLPINGHGFQRVEVVTGPERRRRWSCAEKARIVAETLAPDAVASSIALRYGVHRNQPYAWRKELRAAADEAARAGVAPLDFVPAVVTEETAVAHGSRIEIEVAGALVGGCRPRSIRHCWRTCCGR